MSRISVTMIMLLVLALSAFCTDASTLSCCRKYTQTRIPMPLIRGFSIQSNKENCHLDAVIFHAHGGRNICTDPSKAWVMENIRKLRDKVEAIKRKRRN
ncbi:chemokine C-C motif ligand 20-like precursor [Triplophysa rosa]|uniref:C-C motif chemokine n=2 Tax=Triplophysa rosa TaxID=992332 RepID=A0A9W7WVW7_TRIRA|nr:chemokine C-C motif ligand 20-like precursor [Triplophysa rosa]